MQTIVEQKGAIEGIKMAFVGDIRNNVTYDLMRAAHLVGFSCSVAGPSGPEYQPESGVAEELAAIGGPGESRVCATAEEAVSGADVVYTDSWMSYGIPKAEADARFKALLPFQVTEELMALTAPGAIFMNCLPAARGEEQTSGVIDGPQSVVFDQAENRLHAQKGLLLKLMGADRWL